MTHEEDQAALAEYQAETMWVTQNYQELINLMEDIDVRNKRFERQCREVMKDLEEEGLGDC